MSVSNSMAETESDDELPQLSAHALAALQEFCNEHANKLKAFSEGFQLKHANEVEIDEDWVTN